METCKVYVGTYKKYNSGSIAGGWISLQDCRDYNDFLSKCRKLHADERDAEFMIQDTENFPDGLECGEWIDKKEYDDVKKALSDDEKPSCTIVDYSEKAIAVIGDTKQYREAFKAIRGSFNPRLTCGAGWIFSKKRTEDVKAILAGAEVAETKQDTRYADTLREYAESTNDKEYYLKHNVAAVKLRDKYYIIEKASIENRFCFHDEGPSYDFYKKISSDDEKLKDYFLSENRRVYTSDINSIKENGAFVKFCDNSNRAYVSGSIGSINDDYIKATDEETKEIINALEYALQLLDKRLNAYIKRYGVSKLYLWTYWADA